jgi:FAD/FMN-containing dehydrogenase
VAGAVDAIHPGAVVAGCAALGVLRVGVTDAPRDAAGADAQARLVESQVRLVETLRATVGSHGGSVVVERGPRELRARVDAWGPVEPGALALMRALKDRFDPTGVLNRGRFVGGL